MKHILIIAISFFATFSAQAQSLKDVFVSKDLPKLKTYISTKGANTPDNGYYPIIVQEALQNDATFSSFKRHPWYTAILEHVSYEDGNKYLEIIKNEYK